jgi:hypothetical protein
MTTNEDAAWNVFTDLVAQHNAIVIYAVLDGTHYPVAAFRSLDAANDYAAKHPPHCYVVRTMLRD